SDNGASPDAANPGAEAGDQTNGTAADGELGSPATGDSAAASSSQAAGIPSSETATSEADKSNTVNSAVAKNDTANSAAATSNTANSEAESANSANGSAVQAEELPNVDPLLPLLPATQQLTYAAMGMSFQLTADADNPELFRVTKMATWNSLVMEPAYKRLIDAKATSVKETLASGRTSVRFVSNNLLFTFILNKEVLVRMELEPVLEESE
ncbi:MAG: hypothetical protein K0Q63_2387, partial [Paenibacillus sp.]|nr:hypothetical protein [Paenibacillus sp.]